MRLTLIFVLSISLFGFAQDPLRFDEEVTAIQQKYDTIWDASKETIVFTGSSSIRMWGSLESSFPQQQIVNSGFGGSEASDLLAYADELIHRFNPNKVCIYEGDNDINSKKKPKRIIHDIQLIIADIWAKRPATKIVLIAAKPSISRWHLKRKYKRLNRKFIKLSRSDSRISYADVWSPMLVGNKVNKDIFISDGLHMNAKGYQIWYNTLKNHIEN